VWLREPRRLSADGVHDRAICAAVPGESAGDGAGHGAGTCNRPRMARLGGRAREEKRAGPQRAGLCGV